MLNRLQKSMSQKDKGFTLVELLVVVVIIGILAGIAIPLFLSQKQKGVEAGIKSDLKNAATIQETYFVDESTYANQAAFETTEFRATPGNDIAVATATPTAYCIDGSNADGTDKIFSYDSATGLIEDAACPVGP